MFTPAFLVFKYLFRLVVASDLEILKVRMNEEIKLQSSSSKVFADLVANPDELLIKAELVRQISHVITAKNLTQTVIADLLGVNQPKISVLLYGKLSGFSIKGLFRFLNALGSDVEIRVITKSQSDYQAQTKVLMVN